MMKNLKITIVSFFIISACQSFDEASKILKNEKIKTTDEFLVKKRNPLILPPEYDKIPKPDSISEFKETDEEKIKKMLRATEIKEKNKKTSSIEENILEKIKE